MGEATVFLLIEPSLILRSVLHGWLANVIPNSHVFIAANGTEALQFIRQAIPSYVLIELNLPDRRGLELSPQLRQDLPKARIIATSWYESRWFIDRVLSAGADDFVSKDKLRSELLPLWKIPMEHRMDDGKTSAVTDH